MGRKTNRYIAYLVIFVILGLGLLFLLLLLLNTNCIKQFLIVKLSMKPYDTLDVFSNWLSIVFSVFLGLIVYNQSQKINNLESSKFDLYIGVVGMGEFDGDIFLAEELSVPGETFGVFESFSDKLVANTFILSMGLPAKEELDFKAIKEAMPSPPRKELSHIKVTKPIALLFITKNQPLITSLQFSEIEVYFDGELNLKKKGAEQALHRIFADNSQFTIVIDLPTSPDNNVKDIEIILSVIISDQLSRVRKLKVISRIGAFNNAYYLYSSESIFLPK